jgi:hypothetical protein
MAGRPDALAGLKGRDGDAILDAHGPALPVLPDRLARGGGRAQLVRRDEPGAIFESVFHDIRPPHRDRRVMPNQYIDRILAPVVTARPLTFIDLTTDGLHAIGISRAALIESTSRRFPWTIEQAVLLRASSPAADGFAWVSRARDTALSVVLYGNREDRSNAEMLASGEGPAMPLGIGAGLELLRTLAEAARITIVLPDEAS